MKEKFKAFYDVSETDLSKIWANNETVFIFDTNILLNLYQYSQETQNEFFKILNIVKDRIWIPFHVALEYQRRRLEVIRDEKAVFRKINDKLASIEKSVGNNFSEFKLKARNPELFNIEEKFKADVCSLIDKFKVEVDKVGKPQPCVRTPDEIRAKLDGLLEGKVGDEPEKDWVLQISEEGLTRYENKVPPGYKDVSKDNDSSHASFIYNNIEYERKFGDLIIWKQILEHLKNSDNIKNVIFITDDSKEDWWEIVDSGGDKNIGARPELKSEMYRETEVKSFKMYHTNDFLTAAKEYFDISIDDKAIEETEDLFNNSKLKNILEEELSHVHNKYSEVRGKEALLEKRIANLQTHSKDFSDEELSHLQNRYKEAFHEEVLLDEQLSHLQNRYKEISREKTSIEARLSHLQTHSNDFSDEELAHLQNRYKEVSFDEVSLEAQLSHLQSMSYKANNKKTLLSKRIKAVEKHGKKFSNEELIHLQKRYNEISRERGSLEARLSHLQNNYSDILRKQQ